MLKAVGVGRLALASTRSLAGTSAPSGSIRPSMGGIGAWRWVADGTALSRCRSELEHPNQPRGLALTLDRPDPEPQPEPEPLPLSSGYHGCKSAAGYNAHMQAVFVSIDRNEDGAICRNELRAALAASSVPTPPDHEVTLDAMRRTRSKQQPSGSTGRSRGSSQGAGP